MKLVTETLASVPQSVEDKRLEHLSTGEEQGLCMDAGYDYDEVREVTQEFGYTTHIRNEAKRKRCAKRVRRRDAGLSNGRTVESTATDAC